MSPPQLPELLETKITLAGERKLFRCRTLERTASEVVVLFISTRAYEVAGLTLPVGTVTFGYFWTDRPYNVYHWMTPRGETVALYFNLAADTALSDAGLSWRDLVLDLLVRPGAAPQVLDEADLPADLDPATHALVDDARCRLLADLPSLLPDLQERSQALWQRLVTAGVL